MDVRRPLFDEGFAHEYPKRNGLAESFIAGQRVITERTQGNDYIFISLKNAGFPLLPTITSEQVRMHLLPTDSRDLTSYVRLASTATVQKLGQLLGYKLRQIHDITNRLPIDDVVEHWAVHSEKKNQKSLYGGVDLKLLPPFENFEKVSISSIGSLVLDSMIEGNIADEKAEQFIEGVESGANLIG